jgi:protein-tyrosine phosphatase
VNGDSDQDAGSREKLRKLAPKVLREQRGVASRSGSRAGRIYARLRLLDMLKIGNRNQRLAPGSSRSFLFVCFGNIMRSAMAEAFMRRTLRDLGVNDPKVQIMSAGLHAVPGRETHPWALEAAAELGAPLDEHRARLLTRRMVEHADCVLAMDFQNQAELLALYPAAKEKICMMSAYADGPWKNREIPDPYLTDLDGTRYCARQLQVCVQKLVRTTLL